MNPTDYWETASEGLGTSYAGGWAVDPATGASRFGPITEAWGVRLVSDPNWPSAKAGTGLLIDTTEVTIFTGQDQSNTGGGNDRPNATGLDPNDVANRGPGGWLNRKQFGRLRGQTR
jgi:hypothetical protein